MRKPTDTNKPLNNNTVITTSECIELEFGSELKSTTSSDHAELGNEVFDAVQKSENETL